MEYHGIPLVDAAKHTGQVTKQLSIDLRKMSIDGIHRPLERASHSHWSRGGHYGRSLSPVRPWLWSSSVGWRLFENICIWKRKMRRFLLQAPTVFSCSNGVHWNDCNGVQRNDCAMWYPAKWVLQRACCLYRPLCCTDARLSTVPLNERFLASH